MSDGFAVRWASLSDGFAVKWASLSDVALPEGVIGSGACQKAALSLYLGFRKYQRPVLASYRICRLFR
jgi:hypothetical protein